MNRAPPTPGGGDGLGTEPDPGDGRPYDRDHENPEANRRLIGIRFERAPSGRFIDNQIG
jgi:hypothetical protein